MRYSQEQSTKRIMMFPTIPQGHYQVAEHATAGLVRLRDAFLFLSLLRLLP